MSAPENSSNWEEAALVRPEVATSVAPTATQPTMVRRPFDANVPSWTRIPKQDACQE